MTVQHVLTEYVAGVLSDCGTLDIDVVEYK
jgi:hypothetical protein